MHRTTIVSQGANSSFFSTKRLVEIQSEYDQSRNRLYSCSDAHQGREKIVRPCILSFHITVYLEDALLRKEHIT